MCKTTIAKKGIDAVATHKKSWLYLPTQDIISKYNAVWRGILNYYSFAYNRPKLGRVQWILKFGLAKTLANKLNLRRAAKVFKKFGSSIKYVFKTKGRDGKLKSTTVSFDWKKSLVRTNEFSINQTSLPWDHFLLSLRTNRRWEQPCAICGITEGIEMHHRRPLKANKTDGTLTGILKSQSRKQIPLCKKCHVKVHSGKYDGPGIY